MAMYYIHVKGKTREAEYSYDSTLEKFKRTSKHVIDDPILFEDLDVAVEDEDENYLTQKWFVLYGKPSQIDDAVNVGNTDAIVTRVEYDLFKKYLSGPEDKTILIGYQSFLPASEELRQFFKYRLLDYARRSILMDLYDMSKDDTFTFIPRTIVKF